MAAQDVLADPAAVARILGVTADDPRLLTALVVASGYVATRTGTTLLVQGEWDGLTVTVLPTAGYVQQAVVSASIRMYKGPDVPFGLAGTDLVAYVRSTMPEVDLALFGHRTDFGVA